MRLVVVCTWPCVCHTCLCWRQTSSIAHVQVLPGQMTLCMSCFVRIGSAVSWTTSHFSPTIQWATAASIGAGDGHGHACGVPVAVAGHGDARHGAHQPPGHLLVGQPARVRRRHQHHAVRSPRQGTEHNRSVATPAEPHPPEATSSTTQPVRCSQRLRTTAEPCMHSSKRGQVDDMISASANTTGSAHDRAGAAARVAQRGRRRGGR